MNLYSWKRMIRAVLLVVLVVALSGLGTGCKKQETITIGLMSNLTSLVGTSSMKALTQYVDELNAAGGINGVKINLVVYDTKNEPAEAINCLKRLVERDNALAAVGLESSARAIPVAATADELKIPVIATTATNEAVTVDPKTGQVHPWMFRVCFIDPYQGYVLADFARNDLGLSKAAALYNVNDPYATGILMHFENRFTELGGEIVTKEGYQTGEVEFRAQLSNIKAKGADCILLPTDTYNDAILLGKQAADLGLDVTFLGADAWVADEVPKAAGKELEGSFVSSLAAVDAPEMQSYNQKYQQKHDEPPTYYSYMTIDAFKIVEAGIRAGATTREKMRDFIENAKNLELLTIDSFNMDPATHNPLKRPCVILTITDNQWKVHKTYVPQ